MPNNINIPNILDNARYFAINAHESINQKRKYTNESYYIHCERVVNILRKFVIDENVLAAAWMHDVLEDVAPHNPDYSEERIRQLFGNKICAMVMELTDSKLTDGNRAARKARDKERLAAASNDTKTIKIADIIDNFIDIQRHDPNFSVVFSREIEQLLPYLSGGDAILHARLSKLLANYKSLRAIFKNNFDIKKFFWPFIRCEMLVQEFEKKYYELYEYLEYIIPDDLYLNLLEFDYIHSNNDQIFGLKKRIALWLDELSALKCRCCSWGNRQVLAMPHYSDPYTDVEYCSMDIIDAFKIIRKRTSWLEAAKCNVCHTYWYIATDIDEAGFILQRLNESDIKSIMDCDKWPVCFDETPTFGQFSKPIMT